MMWEKIREIEHNEYIKYTQVFDVDADIEAMCQDVNSLKEFITLKYTQCFIWDRALNSPDIEDDRDIHEQAMREGTHDGPYSLYVTPPHRVFLKRLDELNNAVFSRFWDDSDCDEKIFYYFALLNFKTHRYDNALRLLNKSIKQESLLESSEQNSVLRLHKRCLRAYCLEYLGLSADNSQKRELLSEAIVSLVGYDVLSTTDTNNNDIIFKIIECAEQHEDLFPIIKTLSNSETSCVFNVLEQYHSDGFIDENVHNKYLIQIAHILSHCLSEIRACVLSDASYQTQLRKKDLYQKQDQKQAILLRIAEKLMSILGDDYITCYATLKAENEEYFSALDVLNTGREKLLGKLKEESENIVSVEEKDNKIKKIERQIAQIDFYCWYFSIFSRKQIAEKSKERFLDYSQVSGDSIANTYYNIVNMKEILLKAFECLRRNGNISDKDKKKLAEAYEEFSLVDLHYSIHTAMSDEWEFLKESYLILQLCCEINIDQLSANSIELSFYKLYSKLFKLYNRSCDFNPNSALEQLRKESPIQHYIFTLSCGGQLVCRGDYDRLYDALKTNNINFLTYKQKSRKEEEQELPKNTANIVVAVDNNSYAEDLNFIRFVANCDRKRASVDRHNIYIDISNLTVDKQTIFCNKIREIKSECFDSSVFCVICNLKSAMLLGCMFSMLEKHLMRLSTPLNSYVISPVEEDVAFDAQSCEKLMLLKKSDFENTENIQWRDISDWGYSFGSCFPNKTKINKSGKVLLLDRIRDCVDLIGYIFCFESGEDCSVNCHAFDVRSNKLFDNRVYVFSDTIRIENNNPKPKSSPNTEHDMIFVLSKLYETLRREHYHLRTAENYHKECDNFGECFNLFTFANESSQEYKALREYLYSYMGILLEKSIFLLLRDGRAYNPQRWVLFTLPQKMSTTPKLQKLLCQKLCDIDDYIKDESVANIGINRSNILSDTENYLVELKKEIDSCSKEKEYYFISYKSKNRTAELCIPVYSDVIYLQKEFKDKLEVAIDVKNFTDVFNTEIEEYIQNQNCVGAFVYLSFDYMCPMQKGEDGKEFLLPAEQDKCFKEIKLLVERRRKRNDSDFKIFPIFIPSVSQRENGCGETLLDLINGAFRIYRSIISDDKTDDKYKEDNECRLDFYLELLGLSEQFKWRPIKSIETIYCDRKSDFSHFKDGDNIKTAVSKYGIWNDE